MNRTEKEIRSIYDRTNGICHLCHKKVFLKNYGIIGGRGAWEVDHSLAKANGGTDHGNNCMPAHIRCNRSKERILLENLASDMMPANNNTKTTTKQP